MPATTLAGSTLEVSLALPTDVSSPTEFAAMTTWVTGACSLHGVPSIGSTADAVTEDLVCRLNTVKVKGGGTYDDVTFMLSKLPGDAMQEALQTLRNSQSAVGAFKFTLTDSTVIYFTGQVARLSLTEGGGKNDINKRGVTVFVHSDPVEEPVV